MKKEATDFVKVQELNREREDDLSDVYNYFKFFNLTRKIIT